MSISIGQFNKRVLLTGAGFSRNWGGRLAREMWEEIFSHPAVQKRIAVRQQLLATPSFEVAFSEIEGDHQKFLDTDRAAIWEALREAFERMDVEHVKQLSNGVPKIDAVGMRDFLRRFYEPQHRVGYVFTLNQDALFEQLVGRWPDLPISLPGIRTLPTGPTSFDLPHRGGPATPDMSEPNMRFDGALAYIKMHGSARWRSDDGTTSMVLGGGKEILIERSPLLRWYAQLFEQALCAGDVRLCVIGYSFRDDHINRVIATAVRDFGARLFVWDKQDPLRLLTNVSIEEPSCPRRTIDLSPFLIGAASRPLAEVLPWGEHPTPEFNRLVSSFFG